MLLWRFGDFADQEYQPFHASSPQYTVDKRLYIKLVKEYSGAAATEEKTSLGIAFR